VDSTTPTASKSKRRKRKRKLQRKQEIKPIKFNNCNNQNNIPIFDNTYPTIFNLAQTKLTVHEKSVLNKGLKFCPTPDPPDAKEYQSSIENLHRKLLLQAYHGDNSETNLQQDLDADEALQTTHKPPTKWIPQRHQCNNNIYKFAMELNEKLKHEQPIMKHKNSNLTSKESKALKRLKNRRDIIFKPADKGGGLVILSIEQYEQEALKQLNNPKHYRPSDPSEMSHLRQKIADNINKHNLTGALPTNSAKYLNVPNSTPGKFYLLPKVHKDLINPPGRPIVAGNNHPTERISQYVDEHIYQKVCT
jgi:hypothetical protein